MPAPPWLIGGRHPLSKPSKDLIGFLTAVPYQHPHKSQENAGGLVTVRNHSSRQYRPFSTQDVLWALGIWSVILGLSPVVAFYMLMVA